jgi:hypothetical protein
LLASVCVLLQLNEWDVRWRQCINAMASWYSCLRWSKSIQSTNSSLTLSLADKKIQEFLELEWQSRPVVLEHLQETLLEAKKKMRISSISQLELRWRNTKECNDQEMGIYWEMI